MEPQTEKGSMGPLIGSIIVIIILVIGAIYFWGEKINKEEMPATEQTAALSASDEVTDLEADLENTPEINVDLENL